MAPHQLRFLLAKQKYLVYISKITKESLSAKENACPSPWKKTQVLDFLWEMQEAQKRLQEAQFHLHGMKPSKLCVDYPKNQLSPW